MFLLTAGFGLPGCGARAPEPPPDAEAVAEEVALVRAAGEQICLWAWRCNDVPWECDEARLAAYDTCVGRYVYQHAHTLGVLRRCHTVAEERAIGGFFLTPDAINPRRWVVDRELAIRCAEPVPRDDCSRSWGECLTLAVPVPCELD